MAKKKCPPCVCPKCLPGWLAQFGDLMSLLLVFFVLLLSMATMDKKKVEEYFEIMRRSMGFLEGAENTAEADKVSLSKQFNHASDMGNQGDSGGGNENGDMIESIQEIAAEFNENNTVDMEVEVNVKGNNEFVLDIPASILFNNGDYKINSQKTIKFIRRIARVIRTMSNRLDIEVVGHSSSGEIASNQIPRDEWDLGALRSIEIVKELIKNKIEPSVLKASTYGFNNPKSDIDSENQRVEIRFISKHNNEAELNNENFFDRIK